MEDFSSQALPCLRCRLKALAREAQKVRGQPEGPRARESVDGMGGWAVCRVAMGVFGHNKYVKTYQVRKSRQNVIPKRYFGTLLYAIHYKTTSISDYKH